MFPPQLLHGGVAGGVQGGGELQVGEGRCRGVTVGGGDGDAFGSSDRSIETGYWVPSILIYPI